MKHWRSSGKAQLSSLTLGKAPQLPLPQHIYACKSSCVTLVIAICCCYLEFLQSFHAAKWHFFHMYWVIPMKYRRAPSIKINPGSKVLTLVETKNWTYASFTWGLTGWYFSYPVHFQTFHIMPFYDRKWATWNQSYRYQQQYILYHNCVSLRNKPWASSNLTFFYSHGYSSILIAWIFFFLLLLFLTQKAEVFPKCQRNRSYKIF